MLKRIVNHSTVLARDEIELTKQEAREKIEKLRTPAIIAAAGAVIFLIALISLCAALVITLANYMSPAVAALLTGAALGLLGIILVLIGVVNIKKEL